MCIIINSVPTDNCEINFTFFSWDSVKKSLPSIFFLFGFTPWKAKIATTRHGVTRKEAQKD